jgi:hypothetical protein
VTVELTQHAWAEDMARCIGGVARFLKWEVEAEVRCPVHGGETK